MACSEPQRSYSVAEVGPKEAAAINAPLLVSLHENDFDAEHPYSDQALEPTLELRAAGSDAVVEVLKPSYLSMKLLAFMPSSKLMPNTKYEASVKLVKTVGDVMPAASEMAIWELTTSEEIREPLAMNNDWKVTFEAGEDETFDCTTDLGSCGGTCIPRAKVAVTKARITLPTVSGGFSKEFLEGTVAILKAGDVDGPLLLSGVDLEPGKPGELLVSMPLLEGATYKPCFQFAAWDAINTKPTNTLCLDEEFPAPAEPKPDPKPEPKPDPKPMPDQPEPMPIDDLGDDTGSGSSSSCSTSGGSHGVGSALLLALGLAALSRRRRQGAS
jgi:MYXO-CTERM domain-containing protein